MRSIDINADMGEIPEAWSKGPDKDLLQIVTSANIACGFHAGDPDSMHRTIELCGRNGVGIGAHPSFNDRKNFGRIVPEAYDVERVKLDVIYQIGAFSALAIAAGRRMHHVKLHGALANLASRNIDVARRMFGAISTAFPQLPVLTIANTAQQQAASEAGLPFVSEIFADRAYSDDGTLVDRTRKGAVLHEPAECADRVLRVVECGYMMSIDGNPVQLRAESVCVHGDTPQAIAIASCVRNRLERAGISVGRFQEAVAA
ncbi:MAG: LamB/YcsF family protein [Rhodobacteraceae bacterium]|nr:LamB/YcsF family protein [Paracoccaceae bacterium]